MSTPEHIAALEREKAHYEARGNKDRAEQVQVELDLAGAPPTPPEPISVTDDPETAADDPETASPKRAAPKTRS